MEIKSYEDVAAFRAHVQTERSPAILRKCDIGPCLKNWTDPQYLKEKLKDRMGKVSRQSDLLNN